MRAQLIGNRFPMRIGGLLAGTLADTSRKTILMGDLNSGPGDIPATLASYKVFPQAGFEDVWGSRQDIRTFGRTERLTTVRPDSYWYDHIMFRPSSGLEAVSRKLTGTKPFTSSPKGPRWSSDHDGVVAVIAEK